MACYWLEQISADKKYGLHGAWRCCNPARRQRTCAGKTKCDDFEEKGEAKGVEIVSEKPLLDRAIKAIGLYENSEEDSKDTREYLRDNLE